MKDEIQKSEPDREFEQEATDELNDLELDEIEDNSNTKIKFLRDKLKSCEQEKILYLEQLQRAKAEFLNAKRRLEEEKQLAKERTVDSHINRILPLCDSFAMAMKDKAAWESIDKTWRTGIESIHTQLQSILKEYNVTEVNPLGEQFDPNLHDAVVSVPVSDEKQNHKVMEVLQLGYERATMNGSTLVRPARVTVGEFTKR